MDEFYAIRDSLIDDLKAAWPEVLKVYKGQPEIVADVVPYGWVIPKGPLVSVPDEGDTRNFHAFSVTFSIGATFLRPQGLNILDERVRLVKLLYDVVTAKHHHGGHGQLEQVAQMLEIEDDPGAQFMEVDLDFRCSFVLERADAV